MDTIINKTPAPEAAAFAKSKPKQQFKTLT